MYLENFHAKLDWRLPVLFLALLMPVAITNFVLFHTIVELVAVIVAILAFVVAFNTYPFSQSHFLMFLGCGYFWIGMLDLFHALSYSNASIFNWQAQDASVHFWVFARLLEALVLLFFVDFIARPVSRVLLFVSFAILVALCVGLVAANVLPTFFVSETGFSQEKLISEVVIVVLYFIAALRIYRQRQIFNGSIFMLFAGSIGLTIVAEVLFFNTSEHIRYYVMLGHVFKLLSFWLIYVALVESTLTQPFKSLSLSADTFNALPDLITVVDALGNVLHANHSAREFDSEYFQQTKDINVHQQFHDSELTAQNCSICQSLLKRKASSGYEVKLSDRWFQISISNINYYGQENVMLHVCRDITASKEAQLNYLTANRLYTVLRLTNKAIISSKSKQDLLESVCDIAVNHGGFAMAWIGMVESGQVNPVASMGDNNHYLANLSVKLDDAKLGKGPVGVAIDDAHVTYVNNMETDLSFEPWRDAALDCGFKSMAAIPVMKNAYCIGVFVIYSGNVDAFDCQTLELLSSLSDDISSVVTYIQAEEKRIVAEAKLHQLSQAVEQSKSAIMITDTDGEIQYVNSYYTFLTGYDELYAIGQNVRQFNRTPATVEKLEQCFAMVLAGNKWFGEVESLKSDGAVFWSKEMVSPIVNEDGQLTNIVWTTEDNTELHHAHETISQLAYFDALTGLPNRRLYNDRFNQAIVAAKRHCNKLAVFYLDLDNFKMINDSWGHDFGDLLLKHVAQTLTDSVREMDTVCRLGGDEFSMIINDVLDDKYVMHVADNILHKLNQKIELAGRELNIGTSIGISLYPDDGEDVKELMKNADMAMYHAKERGKNTFQFFEEFLNVNAQHRLDMERRIQKALDNDEFELFYQPQFNIHTHQLTGVEALIRWPDGQGGYIPPSEFIPIAEETSLIIDIGNWVAYQACQEFKQLIDDGLPAVKVAVNISANQFKQSRLLKQTISGALELSQLPAHLLQLEITEGVLIEDLEATVKVINYLKSRQVTFAIDDFGTGYSSLSYLKTLAVDIIKIDRRFVSDIENDLNDQAIIRAIASMAHELELTVLAEGVENEAQLNFLRQHQCDFVQGFYFAKPMPAHQLLARFGVNH